MSTSEIEKLSSKEVQDYIIDHEADDVQNLLLHNKEIFGVPFAIVADQIIARNKISIKVPTFYNRKKIIYPPSFNLEQSSSEATAKFKLEFLIKEFESQTFDSILDITGGFGIDSFFLCQAASRLDFVEPNASLAAIVQKNFKSLGIKNVVFYPSTAENFLNTSLRNYDFIFVDPSRRDSRAKKVFRLSDSEPDIKNLLPRLFISTKHILIKTSPLLDLQQGINELINIKKIVVVSVANECKEVLFFLEKDFIDEPKIETYNLTSLGEMKQAFFFSHSDEKKSQSVFAEPETYLYEPNASILKSGAFKLVGERFGLKKLHPNTHLYTSNERKIFPGRVFKIETLNFDPKIIQKKKANVLTRNYPLKADELKRKLKLEDGGENYVIGFSGMKKKYVVLATRLE